MGNIWNIGLMNAATFDVSAPPSTESSHSVRENVWNVNNLDVFNSEFVCNLLSHIANLIMLTPSLLFICLHLHAGDLDQLIPGLFRASSSLRNKTRGAFGDQKAPKGCKVLMCEAIKGQTLARRRQPRWKGSLYPSPINPGLGPL